MWLTMNVLNEVLFLFLWQHNLKIHWFTAKLRRMRTNNSATSNQCDEKRKNTISKRARTDVGCFQIKRWNIFRSSVDHCFYVMMNVTLYVELRWLRRKPFYEIIHNLFGSVFCFCMRALWMNQWMEISQQHNRLSTFGGCALLLWYYN